MASLPGGRGQKPTAITQNESFDFRRDQVPKTDGWVLTPGELWSSTTAATTWVVNQLILVYLGRYTNNFNLTQVRINNDVAVASQYILIGLYNFNFSTRNFTLVPNSNVKVPTDTDAIVSTDIKTPVTIYAGHPYFMGFIFSDTTIQIPAFTGTVRSIHSLRTSTISTTGLPAKVHRSTLVAYANAVPTAVYLSQEAAEIL